MARFVRSLRPGHRSRWHHAAVAGLMLVTGTLGLFGVTTLVLGSGVGDETAGKMMLMVAMLGILATALAWSRFGPAHFLVIFAAGYFGIPLAIYWIGALPRWLNGEFADWSVSAWENLVMIGAPLVLTGLLVAIIGLLVELVRGPDRRDR